MKTVISILSNGKLNIIAVYANADDAHSAASTHSYVKFRSAIYGLNGIRLTPVNEFLATPEGRDAWNEFQSL